MFMDIEGVELRGRRSSGKAQAVAQPVATPTMAGEPAAVPYCGDLKPLVNAVEARPAQSQPRGRKCLYFDLETIPDYSRQHLFGLDPIPELPPVIPFADLMSPDEFLSQGLEEIRNFLSMRNPDPAWLSQVYGREAASKKPRKGLFDAVNERRDMEKSFAASANEQRKKMSVTPEFCRVVAMGWAIGGADEQSSVVDMNGDLDTQERLILQSFWSLARQHGPVVGYNITGFDLNVIRARSILLGIQPTRNYADVKPWDQTAIIDLMLSRFPKGGAMKLKPLARLYGIEPPAGDCDGSQVEELAKTNPEKLGEYVRSDVWLARELHRKWMGYFTVS